MLTYAELGLPLILINPSVKSPGGENLGTQFTCFTGTKVQMLTPEREFRVPRRLHPQPQRVSAHLRGIQFTCFTQFTCSTARRLHPQPQRVSALLRGTQFTCFTQFSCSTARRLHPQPQRVSAHLRGTQFTFFTGTKVQILTPEELLQYAYYLRTIEWGVSVYLLYW
jgi:hypothetical protein